jgi:iron complex outermembrane receptor protein
MKIIILFCALLPIHFLHAAGSELDSFDLESLLATDVQITSAMKRTQTASKTAASVYVLSNQQIKNSGVTSIAQALTLVPGMQVRRIDGNKWAISARTPAGRFTSKLLVMIDGQSIYNPSFAGVYWEALNIPLYDIERIEVIKGQGGLLWGSNATNGVVNVITKHSLDTRSAIGHIETGSNLNHRLSFRVGDDLSLTKHSSYRVYGSHESSRKSDQSLVWNARDDAKKTSLGGRVDITLNDDSSLIIQGDYTDINIGQTLQLPSPVTHEGMEVDEPEKRQHAQLMLRLDNRLSKTSNQMFQASMSIQEGKQTYFKEQFSHYDVDYQLNMLMGATQTDIGLNYRYNDIPFTDSAFINSIAMTESITQFGGFLQTSITLVPNVLDLIVGNKSEHNNLTGWEHQPAIRLTWTPNESHFFWTSVSQGVRIPSLTEYDYETVVNGVKVRDFLVTGIPTFDDSRVRTVLKGGSHTEAETSISTELGYRVNHGNWNVDLSLFHTESKNALGVAPSISDADLAAVSGFLGGGNIFGALGLISTATVDMTFLTGVELFSKGGDIVISWQTNSRVHSVLGYSHTAYHYENDGGSILANDGKLHQIFLSNTFQLTDNQTLFSLIRWEDGDAYITDNYVSLDLSWKWEITPRAHLSVTGNNLVNSSHLEYGKTYDTLTVPAYIDRSVILGFSFNF